MISLRSSRHSKIGFVNNSLLLSRTLQMTRHRFCFIVLLIACGSATPAYSTNYDAQWYFQKDSVEGFPTPNSTFGSVPATPGDTVPSVNINKDFGDEVTLGTTTVNVAANVTLKGMDRQFSVYASALANV